MLINSKIFGKTIIGLDIFSFLYLFPFAQPSFMREAMLF